MCLVRVLCLQLRNASVFDCQEPVFSLQSHILCEQLIGLQRVQLGDGGAHQDDEQKDGLHNVFNVIRAWTGWHIAVRETAVVHAAWLMKLRIGHKP